VGAEAIDARMRFLEEAERKAEMLASSEESAV
jgi:hypothetical protein